MPGDYVILLVDSEGPVEAHVSPWDYLVKREGDKRLKPKFSFRRFGGRSRAARRVKFPPANRS